MYWGWTHCILEAPRASSNDLQLYLGFVDLIIPSQPHYDGIQANKTRASYAAGSVIVDASVLRQTQRTCSHLGLQLRLKFIPSAMWIQSADWHSVLKIAEVGNTVDLPGSPTVKCHACIVPHLRGEGH